MNRLRRRYGRARFGHALVEDGFYVVQVCWAGPHGHVHHEEQYDDENEAIRQAETLLHAPWIEGDYIRVITRDGELVWKRRIV